MYKGFVHKEFQKAARILAWSASPSEVVLAEQDQARSSVKCGRKAAGCPQGSFPLLGGCEVATCVHIPRGEADNPSTLVKQEALEKAVPALSKATDRKQFSKVIKAMIKQRKKVRYANGLVWSCWSAITFDLTCERLGPRLIAGPTYVTYVHRHRVFSPALI